MHTNRVKTAQEMTQLLSFWVALHTSILGGFGLLVDHHSTPGLSQGLPFPDSLTLPARL